MVRLDTMVRCVVITRRAFLFMFYHGLLAVPPIDMTLRVRRSSFARLEDADDRQNRSSRKTRKWRWLSNAELVEG